MDMPNGTNPATSVATDTYYNPTSNTLSKKQQPGYYQIYVTGLSGYNDTISNANSIFGICPNVSG